MNKIDSHVIWLGPNFSGEIAMLQFKPFPPPSWARRRGGKDNFAGTAIRPESPSKIYASRAAHMRPTKEVLIMRKALLVTALAFAFAAPAGASQCPQDMAAIDSALQSAQLSEADKAKVMELREQGEELHKAGKHAASVKTLGEAKQILGIQ